MYSIPCLTCPLDALGTDIINFINAVTEADEEEEEEEEAELAPLIKGAERRGSEW